jgi:predicted DCC family thiol-disulfide oxidoreductase YuxK
MLTRLASTSGGPTAGASPIARAAACTVYFDGECPVCLREIAHYRRQRGAEAIAWIDASRCDEVALGPGLDRVAVMSRFHVREADGTLVTGAAAFVTIWRRLPGFAWLARVASTRPALVILEVGYAVFLRARPLWRPAAGASRRPRSDCADDDASIHN